MGYVFELYLFPKTVRSIEKRETIQNELTELEAIVEQYRNDIEALETKLKSAREKERILIQRHIRASKKKKALEEIRRADSTEILQKFDEMESYIERMEAEADLVNYGRKNSLEQAFQDLEESREPVNFSV